MSKSVILMKGKDAVQVNEVDAVRYIKDGYKLHPIYDSQSKEFKEREVILKKKVTDEIKGRQDNIIHSPVVIMNHPSSKDCIQVKREVIASYERKGYVLADLYKKTESSSLKKK